jgi:hypothetical protein
MAAFCEAHPQPLIRPLYAEVAFCVRRSVAHQSERQADCILHELIKHGILRETEYIRSSRECLLP